MNLDAALARLAQDEAVPLDPAEITLWLARDEYAGLDVEAYLSELNAMAREAKNYMAGSLEKQVHGLCRYLFHEMGFHGNVHEYYDPENSYLNQVLDRRTGIPISLSVLAMAVGRRAGLMIEGVGLPCHFIAKVVNNGSEVIFDPFHGGRQLTLTDCENLVMQVSGAAFQATPEDLAATPLRLILVRMLSNLKAIYLQRADFERAARAIGRQCQLCPHDFVQRRDLGLTLVHAGRWGQAIDHLSTYLAAMPQANDFEQVQKVLDQALIAVGKWN